MSTSSHRADDGNERRPRRISRPPPRRRRDVEDIKYNTVKNVRGSPARRRRRRAVLGVPQQFREVPPRRPREVLDDAALDRDLLAQLGVGAGRPGGVDHVAEPLEQGHVLAQLAQGVGRAVRRGVRLRRRALGGGETHGGGFLFLVLLALSVRYGALWLLGGCAEGQRRPVDFFLRLCDDPRRNSDPDSRVFAHVTSIPTDSPISLLARIGRSVP